MSTPLGRVLITGGSGFVGAYLVRDLLARGDSVVVYDENPSANVLARVCPDLADDAVRMIAGSTLNALGLLRVCKAEGIDRIVHLASPLTQSIAADPPAGIAGACVGTANVFEVARTLELARVVWSSSITVFGSHDSTRGGVLANDAPHRPASLYGSCKSLCEALSADYRARGLDVVGLRLQVLYGAWRERGLKPVFGSATDQVLQAMRGEPVVVSTPEKRINWQYIEDVSDLLIRTLSAPTPAEAAYNTNGHVASFREYAELLMELVPGADIEISENEDESAFVLPFDFDDTAFRRDIGYGKQHTLADGLAAALAVYSAGQVHDAEIIHRSPDVARR